MRKGKRKEFTEIEDNKAKNKTEPSIGTGKKALNGTLWEEGRGGGRRMKWRSDWVEEGER